MVNGCFVQSLFIAGVESAVIKVNGSRPYRNININQHKLRILQIFVVGFNEAM